MENCDDGIVYMSDCLARRLNGMTTIHKGKGREGVNDRTLKKTFYECMGKMKNFLLYRYRLLDYCKWEGGNCIKQLCCIQMKI